MSLIRMTPTTSPTVILQWMLTTTDSTNAKIVMNYIHRSTLGLNLVDNLGLDSNCDGSDGVDWDGDQVPDLLSGGTDCDDTRADVYPGAEEIWYDGVNQGCNGINDFDQDQDNSEYPLDCNDTDPEVHPDQREIGANSVDDDCDLSVDEFSVAIDSFPMDGYAIIDIEGGDPAGYLFGAVFQEYLNVTFDMLPENCTTNLCHPLSEVGGVIYYDAFNVNGIDADSTSTVYGPDFTYVLRSNSTGGCITWTSSSYLDGLDYYLNLGCVEVQMPVTLHTP